MGKKYQYQHSVSPPISRSHTSLSARLLSRHMTKNPFLEAGTEARLICTNIEASIDLTEIMMAYQQIDDKDVKKGAKRQGKIILWVYICQCFNSQQRESKLVFIGIGCDIEVQIQTRERFSFSKGLHGQDFSFIDKIFSCKRRRN